MSGNNLIQSDGISPFARKLDGIKSKDLLNRIKDPQIRLVAENYIELVNEIRSGQIDMERARFMVGMYKELVSLISWDWSRNATKEVAK